MGRDLPRFVSFGEALTDFIRRDAAGTWLARPGGSPWNVARVAARLGVAAAFAGAVGADPLGDELAREGDRAGLDSRFLQRADRPPLLALVHATDPPRYAFVGDADQSFDPAALPPGWLAAAAVAHFGSISLAREPLATRLVTVAERCRAAGVRVTFDPNHRLAMGPGWPAIAERLVRLAHVVKLSVEDLRHVVPGRPDDEALGRLRDWNPAALVLLTRGAEGIRLVGPEHEIDQPAFAVPVADTVGAGDACLGGWVASWLARPDAPLRAHLAFAAATAAAACRRPGAYAPARDEVEAVLAE